MFHYFTSESVSNGHPDKVADQISDAILDAIIKKDKHAHVACETLVKNNNVIIAGEVKTKEKVNYEKIVRKTICNIGYDSDDLGFNGNTCVLLNLLNRQSPDIDQGVTKDDEKEQGAGDQGIMFGFACDETESLMPAPIYYAHKLMQKQEEVRKSKLKDYLRPDAKCQVTFAYENDVPKYIDTIVFSTQHNPDVNLDTIKEAVIEEIVKKTIPEIYLNSNTKYFINPTGKFVIGGPVGDCGLTGRKIIVDTYGGYARHGGGAFSGKDPSKVDRSAAYYARYIAKNIVASKLAKKCEIQLAYAIGVAKPVAIYVNTFGTGLMTDEGLSNLIETTFNPTPYHIIRDLNLLKPIYLQTSCYGHFGRNEFTWEKTDKINAIKHIYDVTKSLLKFGNMYKNT